MEKPTKEFIDSTPLNQPEFKARITSLVKVYHQGTDQPIGQTAESSYAAGVKSGEQVYMRRKPISKDWEPLDTGWIGGNYGMVLLLNADKKNSVEVATASQQPLFVIPPGQDFKVNPLVPLFLRGEAGEALVVLYVFPK